MRGAVLALAVSLLAGCGAGVGEEAPGTSVEILLGGQGAEEHVVPARVVVASGGRVRFTTVDRRVHTIRFVVEDMTPAAREFIESTRQVNSPPLLQRGAVFEVWFREAPRGFYPFLSESHGAPVEGVIVVE